MSTAERRCPVLPVRAYTDPAWFEREQRLIFARTWQFAGFLEDFAGPGDFVTVQCGPTNLLVVKGHDHRLRAFHNLCRHRGTQLLRAVGRSQKAIACPYHDWTYGLDGRLLSVPDEAAQFPGLDKSRLCLHGARVETWRGLVFVHPEPEGADLLSFLGEAADHLCPHHPDRLTEYLIARSTHTIEANWKIVAENYIDGYHLARLHSGTLHMYDHARQETRFAGPHYLFYEPHSAAYAATLPSGAMAPLIDHVQSARPGAYVPLLFPNLGLAGTESSFSTFHIEPVSPTRTRVHLRSKGMPMGAWSSIKAILGGGVAVTPKDASYPTEHPLGSADFMAEDVYVCEQQQRSFSSPWFSVGASAAQHEAGVRGLQRVIAEAMGEPIPDGVSTDAACAGEGA